MAGNVWEWCLTAYRLVDVDDWDIESTFPHAYDETSSFVIRGGSWRSEEETDLRTNHRYHIRSDAARDDVGFRLIKD
jgi:formylglycine-generating enzyme required for sulfatase activity